MIILYVANDQVGPLLEDLSSIPQAQITLDPHEVLIMIPPDDKVADSIAQVKQLSPIEVWLHGLQSIGSWKSYIGYVIAAGIVAWIGLFTNTIYLLVAAMLIAPFGGPVMNASLAVASGDADLMRRSILRYAVGLIVLMLTSFLVSVVLQQERVTNLMMDVGQISAVAALLPTVTGAVGAMNLMEPERNSLVPGTAVGSLVAASLAPPAGVAGMAASLQQWTLMTNACFLLVMQLVFITLSGALVFRFYGGINSEGSRFQRGRSTVFRIALAAALLAGIGLLFLQFRASPSLQRSSRAQRAVAQAEQVVDSSELARFVSAEFRFTEPNKEPGEILLGSLFVQRMPAVLLPDEEIEAILVREIQANLLESEFDVTPLLTIFVLEAPEQGP
jgi:uncharacterized hydrophobic protein (TIGR00271 family)